LIGDEPISLEEAKLRYELTRIRNTYSFNLGLLITESLFRKPWKIILFPYLFVKMNLQYIKNKASQKAPKNIDYKSTFNDNCLLIFVASEGGMAACERAKELADNWLEKYEHHLVIVTSNTGLIGFNKNNVSLYTLPDPKSKDTISTREWNKSCENTLFRAIYTHLPSRFIFDGPYPYRGVVNAIDAANGLKSIWIHSERTNKETIQKRVSHFTEIKKLSYESEKSPQHEVKKRNYHALTNKILLATEYGYHETNKKSPNLILKYISNYDGVQLIGTRFSVDENYANQFTQLLDNVIDNPELKNLQAAIVSDNFDLIARLHSLMIPTLCILHKNTSNEVKEMIVKLSKSGSIFVTDWNSKSEIKLYIEALLNREWNLSISQRGSIKSTYDYLIDFISK
tara:strand:- start:2359 stop:3552 length:1194 start_codon:yes stop_codon:yes gene_type:complete